MSDSRKAFEKWADTFNTESDEWQDMEVDKVYEQGWRDSRQALKGEPAMWSLSFNGKPANHFTTYPTRGKAEDYIARCKIGEKEPEKVNIEVVPLYTHPASADKQAVSVPEEPTDEMLEAAMSDRDRQYSANAKRYLRHVYQAMVKAAQQPPVQKERE